MSVYFLSALAVCVGIVLANLIVEAFTGRDWDAAGERIFYQVIAVAAFLLALVVSGLAG